MNHDGPDGDGQSKCPPLGFWLYTSPMRSAMTLGDRCQEAMWSDRETPTKPEVFWFLIMPPWWRILDFWKDLYG